MKTVYVDTGGFLALMWSRDRHHQVVSRHFRNLRKTRARLVTSDPVISETVTRLRYDAGMTAVVAFQRVLDAASPDLRIRESDIRLRKEALAVMARYGDLKLSYADCVGAVVAQEVHADAVFGLDRDFLIMGFRLEPTY